MVGMYISISRLLSRKTDIKFLSADLEQKIGIGNWINKIVSRGFSGALDAENFWIYIAKIRALNRPFSLPFRTLQAYTFWNVAFACHIRGYQGC
jgi:hypothetical protein